MSYLFRGMLVCLLALTTFGCGGGSNKSAKSEQSLADQADEARKDPNANTRAAKLLGIAQRQLKAQDKAAARNTLSASNAAINEIADAAQKAEKLGELAAVQLSAGMKSEAVESINAAQKAIAGIKEANPKASALVQLAKAQAALDKRGDAGSALQEAEKLILSGEETTAMQVQLRVDHLAEVATTYHKIKFADDAKRVIKVAREQADQIKESGSHAKILAKIARELKHMEDSGAEAAFDEALAEAEKEPDAIAKANAYLEIAKDLDQVQLVGKARAAISAAGTASDQIKDKGQQSQIQMDVDRLKKSIGGKQG